MKRDSKRFDVLEGHDTLYLVDHRKNIITVFRKERVIDFKMEGRTAGDYMEEALIPEGWKHVRKMEDSINRD